MCVKTQMECQDPEIIKASFVIDRDLQGIKDLALSLTDPDTGDVVRKKKDYSTRQGVCGQPLTESDLTKTVPVCHSKIRSFEWIIDFLVRARSHKKWRTATNGVTFTREENEDYKAKREMVKEWLYKHLAINIGNAGDMVTGQSFQKFSSDAGRALLVSLMSEDDQEAFNQILLGICAVVKVMNSQKRRVNIEKVRTLSQDVYLAIVEHFPWVVVSPSVHRILAHSWEVMELNGGYGLGDLSEEGLESLNKMIRSRREHGARKDKTENNFTDCYNHLWDGSRPTIVAMERIIKCKKAKIFIATEIEALVETLFLEE